MNQVKSLIERRNYGIDLLRLVAMLYVVILHIFGHGHARQDMMYGTVQSFTMHFLSVLTMTAVNIFGLISGYVGYREDDHPYRYSNILTMWLQVVFYNVGVALIAESINHELVTFSTFLQLPFPFMYGFYWYFTAYVPLFFFIPFLNAGIRNCSNRTLNILFSTILIFFSFLNSGVSLFSLYKGYSFVWLMLLYILGAIAKKNRIGQNISTILLAVSILLITAITALVSYNWFELHILAMTFTPEGLESYHFPSTVLIAILHVLLFSRLSLSNSLKKMIRFAAPGAFAVYLLNTHFIVWEHIIYDNFRFLGQASLWQVLGVTLGFSVAFVVCSVLIDHIRQQLFRLLKVPQLCDAVVKKFAKIFHF